MQGWEPPAGLLVDQAIERQCPVGSFEYPSPSSPSLDVELARIHEEAYYAASLRWLLQDPAISSEASHFHDQLLVGTSMIGEEPCSYPFMAGAAPEEHGKWLFKKAWRKFERRGRHKLGFFAAAQYRELLGVHQSGLPQRYVVLPQGWQRFEVPYGLHVQTPPCITYMILMDSSREVVREMLARFRGVMLGGVYLPRDWTTS